MKFSPKHFGITLLVTFLISCQSDHKTDVSSDARFRFIPENESQLIFTNTFKESPSLNILAYEYAYNGAGVATGDFNNDGLVDIYFTGNLTPNKLFINKGQFKFEDVTAIAGVAGKETWKTGVSLADVNADGLLDIYVSNSGTMEDRSNELFINQGLNKNGIPVFKEEAKKYGLDAPGTYTTQVAFFDYDKDGDLDMFMLNHGRIRYSAFSNVETLRNTRHPEFGNRLYRNENEHFVDVSEAAGIFGSGINFGLGIAISDINNDNYPDIYVTNDYEEKDYLYINNQDGTFSDHLKESIGHTSKFSMGVDIADFNNDALSEIVTLDMLPEDNYRQKVLKGPGEYDKYQLAVKVGYHYQNMRNMLHLNTGMEKNGSPVFSEIGQLSGVSNTDWSWAPLFADFDNDGWKDLFISNGYVKDFTNMDFLNFDVAEAMNTARTQGLDISSTEGYEKNLPLQELVKRIPATKVSNYMYRNTGELSFENETTNWGLFKPGVSSGAAYADLDNDGDLDLVVNNTNEPSFLYENQSNKSADQNFISISLIGEGKNLNGIGAKVFIIVGEDQQYQELNPTKGYQSTVDFRLHFGLGKRKVIDEIKVIWPNDKVSSLKNITSNQFLKINQATAVENQSSKESLMVNPLFTYSSNTKADFKHTENEFVDIKSEPLLINQPSRLGPALTTTDVNNDGLDDFYIGGAIGQSGALYLQDSKGNFSESKSKPWSIDSASEDVNALFFDADNDGDMDLYVISGGNEYRRPTPELTDRIYLNNGKGQFEKATNLGQIPNNSAKAIAATDYDKDGDIDLFIGSYGIPGKYPMAFPSLLLKNNLKETGRLQFSEVSQSEALELRNVGLVKDAIWVDYDTDGWDDLFIVGEWMPITIFRNNQGKLERVDAPGLENSEGFWNIIRSVDIDNDGDLDFIVGNLGDNTQFKASSEQPITVYFDDFNKDGRIDPIITKYYQGESYPIASKGDMAIQMSQTNKRFLRYSEYAKAKAPELVNSNALETAQKKEIKLTSSVYIENLGNGQFKINPLPIKAQFSTVQAILVDDFNEDGNQDILIAGNYYSFNVEQGRSDAGKGELLLGNGKGDFTTTSRQHLGILIDGDVRAMVKLKSLGQSKFVAARNNDSLLFFEKTRKE